MTREEAVEYLVGQQDYADDAKTVGEFKAVLARAGAMVGYAPAFRCLVNGVEPSKAIRWGK